MKTLFDAKLGQVCTIVAVKNEDHKSTLRLCELGFTSGEKVRIVAKSLFGRAMLIEVKGYLLSIRSILLKSVVVQ